MECGVNGEGDEDKGSDGVTRIGRVGHGWEMVNWSALLSALLVVLRFSPSRFGVRAHRPVLFSQL